MLTKHALAQNLAVSLTRSGWSDAIVRRVFTKRLPSGLGHISATLSDSLLEALPSLYAPPPERVAAALRDLPTFNDLFAVCRARNIWPAPDLTVCEMAPLPQFQNLDLPAITSLGDLADWLFLAPDDLTALADPQNRRERHGDMAVNHYHRRIIPKRDGTHRLLEAPKQRLKAAQRHILSGLLNCVPPHPSAFGFVPGRNCLHAARRHVGEAMVLRFDLKDFFPGIQAGRIYGLFRCLGYPHAVSRHLTGLCTTSTPTHVLNRWPMAQRSMLRTPHLPQGAPTSPALANQLCHGLDRRLSALAGSLDANYSRYADDLTFSGDPHIIKPLCRLVPAIAREEGFTLNAAKTKRLPATARQTVTGLTVNQGLNVPRPAYDRLKAVIHACSKSDDPRLADAAFRAHLLGQIAWVETVNPARGLKLRHLLEKAWGKRFPSTEILTSQPT